MLAYFLKVNVTIALFYVFYRLFFHKDTFFGWRRIALLSFFAISAVIPLLDIQMWITEQSNMAAMADLYANVILPEFTITQNTVTDWKSLIFEYITIGYWGITSLLALRFLIQLAGIIRLSFQCRKTKINKKKIYLLSKKEGPFSFFQLIFINPSQHSEEELNEILDHEQTHAHQWHSIDIIISELICILCWFNPFAWLMKHEVCINLEYMADDRVLENGYDSKTYQYHLLELSHQKAAATIYNNFNVLPLKKRIHMMNKKRTKEVGRVKYLMFLPLIASLMIISNIEAVARTTKKIASEVIESTLIPMLDQPTTAVNDTVIADEPIFEVVETMPQFPGGMEELMKFLGKNIKYPIEAKNKKIEGRVTAQFIVNKDGKISHIKVIRSVAPSLDAEAIRVIQSMPPWKPGMQRGKVVNVRYTVPIVFSLQSSSKSDFSTSKGIEPDASGAYTVVEQMPEYPGGMAEMMGYIMKNIKYPVEAQKAGIQGKVVVQIIVDTEGNITNPKIIRSAGSLLDAEAIRLTKAMPKWKPGKQKGKAVSVKYTYPIEFKLQ